MPLKPQGLTVFVSSSITEFGNERLRLQKEIDEIGFLTSIILERKGARPRSVSTESLVGAKECDIFIGIFGTNFSQLTAQEFEQAFNAGKPCFMYIEKVVNRKIELDTFIANSVKPYLKYQEFGTTSDLIELSEMI